MVNLLHVFSPGAYPKLDLGLTQFNKLEAKARGGERDSFTPTTKQRGIQAY
jgi:hypothetical protein